MKENIKETRLENGLCILTDHMPGVRSATLGFFYRVGSRHEPVELNGITHFIEHAVFKGTEKRSALDIAIEQDRLGGNLDAFTTHEDTGFAIKVIDDQLPQAFDLIADMLANPRFDGKDLKSEQRVIIEELKMVEDSPEEHLGEIFSEAIFPGHPLGMNIAGTPATVRTFDHDATLGYHDRVFRPSNLVIAAAGNVDHEEILRLVEQAGLAAACTAEQANKLCRPEMAAPILVKQDESLEQAHVIIATPLVSARSERRYAADLLANIIGGGMSSRLWQTVREERGLAYSVGAAAVMFSDCGYFSAFAATSPEHCGEVVDLAVAEIGGIVKGGVTNEELVLAKKQARASILLSLEDSAARAAALAQAELLYGRQVPVEETLSRVESVTIDEVNEIARELFRTENVAFAALGDLNGLTVDRGRLAIG
jgi:predicted Zn-dependent peptidase